ncbi:hypothetical protein ACA910_013714 [Epithemia clementina (nom. ined.)]
MEQPHNPGDCQYPQYSPSQRRQVLSSRLAAAAAPARQNDNPQWLLSLPATAAARNRFGVERRRQQEPQGGQDEGEQHLPEERQQQPPPPPAALEEIQPPEAAARFGATTKRPRSRLTTVSSSSSFSSSSSSSWNDLSCCCSNSYTKTKIFATRNLVLGILLTSTVLQLYPMLLLLCFPGGLRQEDSRRTPSAPDEQELLISYLKQTKDQRAVPPPMPPAQQRSTGSTAKATATTSGVKKLLLRQDPTTTSTPKKSFTSQEESQSPPQPKYVQKFSISAKAASLQFLHRQQQQQSMKGDDNDNDEQRANQQLDTWEDLILDWPKTKKILPHPPRFFQFEHAPDYRRCAVNQPFPRPHASCVVHPQTMIPYCHFGDLLQIHVSRIHVSAGNESVQDVWGRAEAEELPRYSYGAFELVVVGDEQRQQGHGPKREVPVPYYYSPVRLGSDPAMAHNHSSSSSSSSSANDSIPSSSSNNSTQPTTKRVSPRMLDSDDQNDSDSMRQHFFYINDVLNSMISTAETTAEHGGDTKDATTITENRSAGPPTHVSLPSALFTRTAKQNPCTHTIPGRAFLITRYEYCNLFHTVMDWFNTFLALAPPPPPNVPPPRIVTTAENGHSNTTPSSQPLRTNKNKRVSILFLDGHARGAFDDVWSTVFGKTYFIKSSFATAPTIQDEHDTTTIDQSTDTGASSSSSPVVCLRDATLVPSGYASVLWPRHRTFPYQMPVCPSMMNAFVDHVLQAYQLQHVSMIPGKITIIDRRPYRAHPRSSWHNNSNNSSSSHDNNRGHRRQRRILDNFPELVQALKQQHQTRLTGNISLSIQVAALETMSFREQLQTIRETNVLIGNHGAGLTHLLFLHDSAMVVEYQPGPAVNQMFWDLLKWKQQATRTTTTTTTTTTRTTTMNTRPWRLRGGGVRHVVLMGTRETKLSDWQINQTCTIVTQHMMMTMHGG